MPGIRADVNKRMTSEHHNAIDHVVLCLNAKPCPRLLTGFRISTNALIPRPTCSTKQAGERALRFARGSLIPGTRNTLVHTHLCLDM